MSDRKKAERLVNELIDKLPNNRFVLIDQANGRMLPMIAVAAMELEDLIENALADESLRRRLGRS